MSEETWAERRERRKLMIEENRRTPFDPSQIDRDLMQGLTLHEHTKLQPIIVKRLMAPMLVTPFFWNRFGEIVGPENSGKTTMSHIIEAAAQQHCRRCHTLIVDWTADDGEIVQSCYCGNNDRSTVFRIESENSLRSLYAEAWGVSVVPEEGEEPSYFVEQPMDGEEAIDLVIQAIKAGIDLIMIDSLASLLPREHRESEMKSNLKVGAKAKMVRSGIDKIRVELAMHQKEFLISPAVIWTNHFTQKIDMRNAKADPRTESGGGGAKYGKESSIRIGSVGQEEVGTDLAKDAKLGVRFKEVRFTGGKTRGSMEKVKGKFRFFNSAHNGQFKTFQPGDTDFSVVMADWLAKLGVVKKKAGKIVCGIPHFEATFTTTKALVAYLERDEVFLSGFWQLLKLKLPAITVAQYIQNDFYYPPWAGETDEPTPKKTKRAVPKKKAAGRARKSGGGGNDRGGSGSPEPADDLDADFG